MPDLIGSVHAALRNVASPAPQQEQGKPTPPVSPKKSVTPDYLISLEDGRHYKSLKRHLRGRGLTPEEYRKKWDLPYDYPMVAPNYAKARSELARSMGLGQVRRKVAEKVAAVAEKGTGTSPKKRGRKKSS